MDIISVSTLHEQMHEKRFNSEIPDFIRVKIPISNNAVEDYFDIVDWEQIDVRTLFSLPLDLVREIVTGERIAVEIIIGDMCNYFNSQEIVDGSIELFIESLRYFREKKDMNSFVFRHLGRFVNKNSKRKELSETVFQALMTLKHVYGSGEDFSRILKFTYEDVKRSNNTELQSLLEGENGELIHLPAEESMQNFESRVAQELAEQTDRIISDSEDRDRLMTRYQELENKKEERKQFWRLTAKMVVAYSVMVPLIVYLVISITGMFEQFKVGLVSFAGTKLIAGFIYAILGCLIFRFTDEEDKVKYIKSLYIVWVCVGILTGLIRLILL